MRRGLGVLGGITAWLGWLTVCPALGFPFLATAAMLNLVAAPRQDPGFWLGWALLIIGLSFVGLLYLAVAGRGRLQPAIASGVAYGVICWVIAGAVVMPLLGLIGTPAAAGAPVDAMRGSFMMLDLGIGAPIAALVAWLMFGAVLGVSAIRQPSAPADAPDPATRRRAVIAVRGALAIAVIVLIVAAVGRLVLARAGPTGSGNQTLVTATVQSLPQGTDFFSVIELSQPPGATLGPHVHAYSGAAYGLNGVATIDFSSGKTTPVAPGQAGFIIAGQTHAHRNTDNQLPSALLALLIVVLALGAGVLAFRSRLSGLIPVALVLLIVAGTLGILNPWSNDWLFISVRSTTGRAAEMPMATSARLFESPSIGPFAPGPYTETLAEITLLPRFAPLPIGSTGTAVLVVVDGQVELTAADGSSVDLGSRGATVLKPGSDEMLGATGGQPAHVLELAITPAAPGS
jgi:quercetin dioxygenase-like cupin family protein